MLKLPGIFIPTRRGTAPCLYIHCRDRGLYGGLVLFELWGYTEPEDLFLHLLLQGGVESDGYGLVGKIYFDFVIDMPLIVRLAAQWSCGF